MHKVTVLLSVHNGAEYLAAAVKSVLTQTYRDYELLIIDDGSTDRTPDIIKSFSDPRIRCIRHEHNLGLIASLNEGLAVASGEFVARMDADDICHTRRLELQVGFLEKHPEIGVVGSAIRLIDGQGRLGSAYVFPEKHSLIFWALAFLCPIVHPSVMMRRDLILASGGYSSAALHAEDYELWDRLSSRTQLANLPLPLLKLRKHGSSVTVREVTTHTEAAMVVSARCMSRRLGYEMNEVVSACLVSGRYCDKECVRQAAEVLSELYAVFNTDTESLRSIVRRDVALRTIMLALRCARGSQRIALIRRAQSLDFWAWPTLFRRTIGRFTGIGLQRVVG